MSVRRILLRGYRAFRVDSDSGFNFAPVTLHRELAQGDASIGRPIQSGVKPKKSRSYLYS